MMFDFGLFDGDRRQEGLKQREREVERCCELPAKIGDGVFGSSCGGVNPTGASFTAGAAEEDSVFSARMAA
jgi:hypothetical protein